MSTDQQAEPKQKLRWYRLTPGRLLLLLLVVEGALLFSERWFPKGYAVLIAIAAVAMTMGVMLLWFVVALIFRLRFQFSIRSLLVLTVAVAVPSSWLAVEKKGARRQKEAVEAIRKMEGVVNYDFWLDASHNTNKATHYGPVWLRKMLGRDFFDSVDICGYKDPDVVLKLVSGLPDIQSLSIVFSPLTAVGLEYMSGITQLKILYLRDTKLSDSGVERLGDLNQLQLLLLDNNNVSDKGLRHLTGLSLLQKLFLRNTQVTAAGVAELQKALPNCKIEH